MAFDMLLESDVMVAMRDGVRLATDVYLPARGGRAADGAFPVILERTPYDKTSPSRSERSVSEPKPLGRAEVARFFVSRGYALVYQDCRGTHRSEGRFEKYLSEGEDGYDAIAWIRGQAWCDGKIGTMGLSYAAHAQVAAACLDPPGLAAMFVDSGGFSDAYQGGIRQGGAFELKQATWAHRQAALEAAARGDARAAAALEAEDMRAWFARMPWRKGSSPLRWAPDYEDYLFEQWGNADYGGYWKRLGICAKEYYDRFADVPMVHLSSWYDPYPRTATENYLGLSRRKRGPVSLILGPWTHGDRCLSWAGDVDFGPGATIEGSLAEGFLELRLRWFDRWLKGIDNGVDSEPRVRYFRMGGGRGTRNAAGRLEQGGTWLSAEDWPPPDSRELALYLGGDGSLGESAPPPGAPPLRYAYDPERPVPSIGGSITSGEPVMRGGAFDQVEDPRFFGCSAPFLPLSSRPDVLVFETGILDDDLEVTGPVSALLWVSSDCPDSDFTIKLIDLHPPSADYPRGFAMNLCDGILRARYRESWERPAEMRPGEAYRIRVEAFPTSNLFARGHRIRLDVSSSNFPHFDANPNTGEALGSGRLRRVAVNSVYMDAARTSLLLLRVRGRFSARQGN
ncbi:MAG TPA: CocE/NonD family hydrolase [Spirochaetia bacterium]|nr:CocE/NonD family hydrolase [Spirochaetia bacterium]